MGRRRLALVALTGVALIAGVAVWTRDFASQAAVERNLHEYAGDFWEALGPLLRSPAFFVAAVAFVAGEAWWWRRSSLTVRQRARRVLLHAALGVYVAAVLALTTFPVTWVGWHRERLESLVPGRTFSAWARYVGDGTGLTPVVRDILGNVVAFVPAGVLLPLGWERFRRLRATVLTVALAAGAIELSQLVTDAEPSFDDLLLNLIGATLGYGVWRVAHWARTASRSTRCSVMNAAS